MSRTATSVAAAVLCTVLSAGAAHAANYIIYLQGRGWQNWDNMQSASVSGWTNVYLTFDGNAALNNSTVISTINNAITADCENGNSCVILGYSAGVLRMQKAVSDLRAAGHGLAGLLWAEGTAGAAGGTHLAEISTQGGTKFIAKIIGQQEKIDLDLTPSAARSHYTSDFGKQIYNVAGNQDICKGFSIFKLCANTWVTSGIGGYADGVVPMASAGGCNTNAGVTDYSACAKYAYHTKENRVTNVPGSGEPFDHFGMPNDGAKIVQVVLTTVGATAVAASWSSANGLTHTACINSGYDCDDSFYQPAEDYSKKPNLTPVATDVSAKASNTTNYTDNNWFASLGKWKNTCNGHCGGSNSSTSGNDTGTCYCDSGCTSRGDCCIDYSVSYCTAHGGSSADCNTYNSNCNTVNAQ